METTPGTTQTKLGSDISWHSSSELYNALMTEDTTNYGEYLLAYLQAGKVSIALAYSHGDRGIYGNPEPPTFEVASEHARVFQKDGKWFVDFGRKHPCPVLYFAYVDFSFFPEAIRW